MFSPNKIFRAEVEETGDTGMVDVATESKDIVDPIAAAEAEIEKVKGAFSARLNERDQKLAKKAKEIEELKARLDAIEQAKLTEAEEKEAIAKQAKEEKLLGQQKYDEALALQKEDAAKEIAKKDSIIQQKEQELTEANEKILNALVNRDFNTAFMGAGGFENQAQLLFPHYKQRLSFNFETNTTEILNPATSEPLTDSHGNPYTLETFVEEVIKESYPTSFSAQIKGGTGADASKRPSARKPGVAFEELIKMKSSSRARFMGAKASNG